MEYKLTPTRFQYHLIQAAASLRAQGQQFLQAEATPHQKALSFSLGTLISLLPTPGLNLILVSVLAASSRQLHKASLLAAVGVWNAFVVAPFYALALQIGGWLFGETAVAPGSAWTVHVIAYTKGFLVGNVLLAAVFTCLSYLLVKTITARRSTQDYNH